LVAEESAQQSGTESNNGPGYLLGQALAYIVVLGLPVGLFFLAKGLYPTDLPATQDPDFLDSIFQNKGVIWAARLLLVSAAGVLALGGLFIIASIVVRMKNREWLRRAGPFEVSERAVEDLENQIEFWRSAALTGQDEIEQLKDQLEESDSLIEFLEKQLNEG
jgi:hypothetical protein